MHFLVFALWPAGFYCPEGTGFDLRGCPEGSYGPDPGYWSVSQCRRCDGGHYCSSRNGTAVTGPCREGYYCSHGNTSPQPLSQAAGKQTSLPDMHCMFTQSDNTCNVLTKYVSKCKLSAYLRKWFSISIPILRGLTNGSFVLCVSHQKREGHVLPVITAPRPPSILCPVHVEPFLIAPN